MKKQFLTYIATLTLVFLSACGGCGDKNNAADGGDPNTDAAGPCNVAGTSCTEGSECCSGECDPETSVCVFVEEPCRAAGAECNFGPDCCTGSCIDGTCSADQCTSDGEACEAGGECCSGTCGDNNTCTPLNDSCKTSGNACTESSECCSQFCNGDGLCSSTPSFCGQTGDVCTEGPECCGGLCNKAEGATLGLCGVPEGGGGAGNACLVAGEVCGPVYDPEVHDLICSSAESGLCCSRSCAPFGASGVMVCQPASGCRPTGDVCLEDTDCCGNNSIPNGDENRDSNVICSKAEGETYGRCGNWQSCNPSGNTCKLDGISCSQEAQCCAGNTQNDGTCNLDSLGIPRCTIAQNPDCTNPESYAGQDCSSSADCCGLPCVPKPGGVGFVCGGACIVEDGACTTTADCCSGLECQLDTGTCGPPDDGGGDPPPTCSAVGQACETAEDCCNAVECNANGTCGVVIID